MTARQRATDGTTMPAIGEGEVLLRVHADGKVVINL